MVVPSTPFYIQSLTYLRELYVLVSNKQTPLIWPFINFASQPRSWNLKRHCSWWQDVTRWDIFGCNPMTKIVCGVGSAHIRAVHCMCAQLKSRNLIMWTLPPVHGAMNEGQIFGLTWGLPRLSLLLLKRYFCMKDESNKKCSQIWTIRLQSSREWWF